MADRSGILHHDTDNVRSVAQLVQEVVRDLHELIEKVIDRCRDVGNIVFQIVLKHS